MTQHNLVATVVGARPQFVKAAAVSPAMRKYGIQETIIHTGQHYDWEMSAAFFEGLCLPEPSVNLGVGSGSHGRQTGRMLAGLEEAIVDIRPGLVLVYGDTNSTLAGALAAAKLHVPVAHVEAGLRSFNRRMPEEVNRVLTDHLSSLLFAPTARALENLEREGIRKGVIQAGDVMYDLVQRIRPTLDIETPRVLADAGVLGRSFALLTVHRAENTDDPARWDGILEGVRRVASGGLPIVWLAHPRVAGRAREAGLKGMTVVKPLPYLETQILLRAAHVVLTDSGGLQKEAAAHGTSCVTLRDETEWVELVDMGANVLAGADADRIVTLVEQAKPVNPEDVGRLYGNGLATTTIVKHVAASLGVAPLAEPSIG